MRALMILGVILVVVGVGSLFVNVVPIFHREQIAKIGSITATQDKETDFYIPPYAGIIVVVVGAALVFAGRGRA